MAIRQIRDNLTAIQSPGFCHSRQRLFRDQTSARLWRSNRLHARGESLYKRKERIDSWVGRRLSACSLGHHSNRIEYKHRPGRDDTGNALGKCHAANDCAIGAYFLRQPAGLAGPRWQHLPANRPLRPSNHRSAGDQRAGADPARLSGIQQCRSYPRAAATALPQRMAEHDRASALKASVRRCACRAHQRFLVARASRLCRAMRRGKLRDCRCSSLRTFSARPRRPCHRRVSGQIPCSLRCTLDPAPTICPEELHKHRQDDQRPSGQESPSRT